VVALSASLRAQPPEKFLMGKTASVGGRRVGRAFHSDLCLVPVAERCSIYWLRVFFLLFQSVGQLPCGYFKLLFCRW